MREPFWYRHSDDGARVALRYKGRGEDRDASDFDRCVIEVLGVEGTRSQVEACAVVPPTVTYLPRPFDPSTTSAPPIPSRRPSDAIQKAMSRSPVCAFAS